jgi:hypothetical protein
LVALEKSALLLVWDNASWHKSQEVQRWLRTQSPPQTDREWRAHHGVSAAKQQPLAESDRAEVGPRETRGGGTDPRSDRAVFCALGMMKKVRNHAHTSVDHVFTPKDVLPVRSVAPP